MACENFEQFLRLASERIPGKRLRERIRKELGDHMADMLADKIEAGTDEKEAKKQVLSEMGDPAVLRKAFIRAHIAEIRGNKTRYSFDACGFVLLRFVFYSACFSGAGNIFYRKHARRSRAKPCRPLRGRRADYLCRGSDLWRQALSLLHAGNGQRRTAARPVLFLHSLFRESRSRPVCELPGATAGREYPYPHKSVPGGI